MFKAVILLGLAVGVLANFEYSSDNKAKVRDYLKQHCKNVAEDKLGDIENAASTFVNCVKGLFDIKNLTKEIEEAKPNGALDEVFKKYCAKTPELKSCIHNLYDGISPCVDASARDQLTTAKNGTDQFIDFICYKDGDRIALFIAEKGPECFQSKLEDLKRCGENFKNQFSTVEDFKKLSNEDKCKKFDELSSCLVSKLETCDSPTPGNMAESLLRFVKKEWPCKS